MFDLNGVKLKIDELSFLLQQPISKDKKKLDTAKVKLLKISKDYFRIDVSSIEEMEEIPFDLDLAFFQERFPDATAEELQQLFSCFLKFRKLAGKLSAIVLEDVAINREIQAKFCKIVSPYGEGTGYIVDDANGLILSSFHLISAVKPLIITEVIKSSYTLSVLYAAGYLDTEWRLTPKAMNTASKENLLKEIQNTSNIPGLIIAKIRVTPWELESILADPQNKKWLMQSLQSAKESPSHLFAFEGDIQAKMAIALVSLGYLKNDFTLNDRYLAHDFDETEITIPTEIFNLFFKQAPEEIAKINEAKELICQNKGNLLDTIYSFFITAKIRKDVVLLTDTVEVHYAGEILRGKMAFIPPEGFNLEDQDNLNNIYRNLYFFDTVLIQLTHFSNDLPFNSGSKKIYTGENIPSLPDDKPLQIGEKVYFGGYPLTQRDYTFSIGIVSSINALNGKVSFVIEAPIAPGNSGSPVFVQRKGEIYWIGIINSEVALVTEKMFEVREKLQRASGGFRLGDFCLQEGLREITTTLLDNLSTGKGKANILGDLRQLFKPDLFDHSKFSIDPFLDFLVPRKIRKKEKKEQTVTNNAQQIYEAFTHEGETYWLNADKHNNKHLKLSGTVAEYLRNNPRYLRERWGNKDATFNESCAEKYRDIIKEVIKAVVRNGSVSNFVRYTEVVGWDKGSSKAGEETRIIELYYGDGGSHIRPKAESWLKPDQIIDILSLPPPKPSNNPNAFYKPQAESSLAECLRHGTYYQEGALIEFQSFQWAEKLLPHLCDCFSDQSFQIMEINSNPPVGKRYGIVLPREDYEVLTKSINLTNG